MAAITLTALTILEGNAPSEAATACACGWRIEVEMWWVRWLKAADPKEPPTDGHCVAVPGYPSYGACEERKEPSCAVGVSFWRL
jgi:hypothetical protein